MEKIFVVVPAYNEEKVLGSVISHIKEYHKNIIVVDDCSADNTGTIAKKAGATVLRHSINRGAGAATKTGIDFAVLQGATKIITMDADGQHDPKDIQALLNASDSYDVVIGSRLLKKSSMPLIRKTYNLIGSIITYLLYGIYVHDSQSGFKVFSRKAAQKIEIKFDRFEFCSEVLHEIRRKKLTFKEVPIKTIYTEYSMSKGQSFFSGVQMVVRMVLRIFMR